MPELPEVEVVRAGLAPAVTGARITAVHVLDARALKRHVPLGISVGVGGVGVTIDEAAAAQRSADFERRLTGAVLGEPLRRGKFMWIPIASAAGAGADGRATGSAGLLADSTGESSTVTATPHALLSHLGMSGQMLLRSHDAPDDRHTRIRIWIEHVHHGELRIDFADQRLFGSLAIDQLVETADGIGTIPRQAVHIARDPLDPHFDDRAFVAALRRRNVAVKKLLLDQALVSGVGNIYADETLWRTRVHPETPGSSVSVRKSGELLTQLRAVFAQALIEGGTSFDEQYVNINGESGYFAHSLNAYGRGGEPCPRCGTAITRVPFGGRSSHFCSRCQRLR